MLPKLLRACASLWFLGLIGMWAARVLLDCGLTGSSFRVAAGCWVLGGVGFTCFALLGLIERAEAPGDGERGAVRPADLSLFLRRR